MYINAHVNPEIPVLVWHQLTEITLKKNNLISLGFELTATSGVWSDTY